jgi:hypothetical protein
MSDIAILKEMIKDTATVSLVDCRNKKKVILEEKSEKKLGDKNANYTVKIIGLPDDSDVIVIKVDDCFKSPEGIFNCDNNNMCKRSDFVIIADTGTDKVIVCIEMKAGEPKNKKIREQLQGSQCFIRYCQEIGKSFWNQDNFLEDYEYRFVAIFNICSSRKRSTAYKEREFLNDSPKTMMKVDSCTEIQFKKLI